MFLSFRALPGNETRRFKAGINPTSKRRVSGRFTSLHGYGRARSISVILYYRRAAVYPQAMNRCSRAALKRQAARRGATLSGLMRSILGEWLEEQGDPVDWVVEWGGRRDENKDASNS